MQRDGKIGGALEDLTEKQRRYWRDWYHANKARRRDKIRTLSRARYEKNKVQICEKMRAKYNEDLEYKLKLQAKCRAYFAKNRDELNKDTRRRYAEKREERRKKAKTYRQLHSKRLSQEAMDRVKSNPALRLRAALRRRLGKLIHPNGIPSPKTKDLFGCGTQFLRQWIERQMFNWMTWENYGSSWQIDHIVPLSAFDLRDERQVRLANHWSNLRPLSARKNLAKRAKIIDPQLPLLLNA